MKTSIETNKYPSWLVPLEIAVKLKKIGFNEACPFIVYPNDDEVVISGVTNLEVDDIDEDGNAEICVDLVVTQCYAFNKYNFQTIPTWEQVFEWFRERGLHSYIEVCCTDLNSWEDAYSRLEKPVTFYKYYKGKNAVGTFFFKQRNGNLTYSHNIFTSYEEAREALVNSLIEDYIKQKDENDNVCI